jgi:hypothetical protein
MVNSNFSRLIEELARQVPLSECSVQGEEFRRVVSLTPKMDEKERVLYWRGADPEPEEFLVLLDELIDHLRLKRQ